MLNFSWISTSPHTYRHTHSASKETYLAAVYSLVITHTHTHTHTYVSKICSFFSSFCLNGEHMYTQICSNNTHYHYSCLVGRVFANGPGDQGSVPGRIILKTQKMVLDVPLFNTQHYKVHIKSKVEQSGERSSALSDTLV